MSISCPSFGSFIRKAVRSLTVSSAAFNGTYLVSRAVRALFCESHHVSGLEERSGLGTVSGKGCASMGANICISIGSAMALVVW